MVLLDQFDGTNGADLNGRALDVGGVAWAVTGGSIDLQGGRARGVAIDIPGREAVASADASTADGVALLIFNFCGATDTGILIARLQDATHYLALVAIQAGPFANQLHIVKRIGESYPILAAADVDLSDAGRDYRLRLALSGETLIGTLDGAHEVTAVTSLYAAETGFGFAVFPGSTVDDFRFGPLVPPRPGAGAPVAERLVGAVAADRVAAEAN